MLRKPDIPALMINPSYLRGKEGERPVGRKLFEDGVEFDESIAAEMPIEIGQDGFTSMMHRADVQNALSMMKPESAEESSNPIGGASQDQLVMSDQHHRESIKEEIK